MPRTTTLDCSGCPPLRALTFDALGLIKVVEARDKKLGLPQVVERLGDPDSSKCVTAVSIIDRHSHPVCLYDISAQRRLVLSFNFRETPIKALAEDIDGYSIYIGNGSGDMTSVDIRTGKMLGWFSGKCSGSIRSIVRHPELPVIASCGLDGYLRLWDTKTRQLLSAVFLKQHVMHVLFDSNFIVEGADNEQTTT